MPNPRACPPVSPASPGGDEIVLAVGVGEPRERLQVGQALAALDPPGPLPPDGRAEAEFERRVEVLVGVAQHAAQQPVDVVGGDRGQRQPPGQVHVARLVQGEVHAVHAAVALQQEAVEGLVVLVRLAAEEGLHAQAVLAHDQPGHGGQLVLPLELDQERPGPRLLEPQLQRPQRLLDNTRGIGTHARTPAREPAASTETETEPEPAEAMAPVYTSISRSAVAGQPNPDACATAPRDSDASHRGDTTRSRSTEAHTVGSCPSTSTPETPSRTAVRSPPTAAATTGVPQA